MSGTLQKQDQCYVANTYARFPVEIVRGKGSVVYDTDGKRYIDMGSGIGVTCFGIADEAWIRAVTDQLALVQHTSNLYYTGPCAELAELLCRRTGMKKVFFCNSGAEANECAVKVARKYAAEKKGPEYSTVLTLQNSFHGRTLTTLAATGQDRFHQLFQPLTPGFVHAPANDFSAFREVADQHYLAGILLECVQGEGGVIALEPDFVKQVAEYAKQKDILLMIDEVQTGNGRTGALYAYMHYGIIPDVVSTAKGIGAGLPLGCTLLGEKAESVLKVGDHGSTFGGNPVACAGAVSVIRRMDDAFFRDVRKKSEFLFQTFSGAKGIESVSGMGLMLGLRTQKPAREVVFACIEKGVLCLTAKEKVRLLPALNIPMELLAEAAEVIKAVCAE